jgi:metal-responsive CopG/Arc/MetJ family transcriptional regulator
MKPVISLPVEALEQIERLARRLKKRSRGSLYREAMARYLRRACEAMAEELRGAAGESVMVVPP